MPSGAMMLGAVFRWASGFVTVKLLGWLLVAALGLAAVQTVRISGFSVGFVRVEGLAGKAARLQKERDAAVKIAAESERLRLEEQAQDQASFGDAAVRCDDRLVDAFDAGVAIGEIVNGGNGLGDTHGENGSADDRPVSAEQLRRVIGQGNR